MRSRAAGLSPQPWPWSEHPRVLIESDDEATGMSVAAGLRQVGYAVAVCPGPAQSERCPLVGDAGCEIAHGADVIVSSLGLGTERTREVVEALQARCAGTPLIVEVTPEEKGGWDDLLQGCEVVVSPVSTDELVAAVNGALLSRSRGG